VIIVSISLALEDKYIRFYDTVSGTELLLVRHSMYACMAIVDIVYS
jgi:hypothetical protein